jgi:hypothetical protein
MACRGPELVQPRAVAVPSNAVLPNLIRLPCRHKAQSAHKDRAIRLDPTHDVARPT